MAKLAPTSDESRREYKKETLAMKKMLLAFLTVTRALAGFASSPALQEGRINACQNKP